MANSKKIVSVLLSLIMAFSVFTVMPVGASAAEVNTAPPELPLTKPIPIMSTMYSMTARQKSQNIQARAETSPSPLSSAAIPSRVSVILRFTAARD